MVSKTHRKDIYYPEKARGGYLIRLYADEWDGGSIGWVDFQVFGLVGEQSDGTFLYPRKDAISSMDLVEDLAQAETEADGFVKWDGCTQFAVGHVHIDHVDQLDRLFESIKLARFEAAQLMADKDIMEDYR